MEAKKVMTRGRRSKIIELAKKIILKPIGVWNLECIGTQCWRSVWAESCSWASICSISLTYQCEHATTFSCNDVDFSFEWQIGWIREDWMLPNGIAGVKFHHDHRLLYKSLLNTMITCTNAFSATVGWIGSPGLTSFASSRSCHSPIA
jgi:hypothetical protein